jgi:MerR family transcriptional regulator, light-induced transcriptional regulator
VGKAGQTVSATRFALLTGVSRERLRTWERRFGFPAPQRVAGGPRRYRLDDVTPVVAVRRAAQDGTPLAEAIRRAGELARAEGPGAEAFRAAVELAPVPVALISGPQPLRLAWANAALRELPGAAEPGTVLDGHLDGRAHAQLAEHFTHEVAPAEIEHRPWGGAREAPAARSLVYRLPVAAGQAPLVAVVGLETRVEHDVRARLVAAEAQLERLRRRGERHDRWLDAIAALAVEFRHEPGPGVIGSALDVLIRQTRAVDAALASYVSGRLELHGSRRGALSAGALTVAAHPEVSRALRDAEGEWLDATTATVIGVPEGLHAAGLPITIAGDVLGLLVLLFDEVEPHDADNRRLLAAVSAAMGFALLRDRLASELRAAVSAGDRRRRAPEARPRPERFARPGAGAPPPGG